MTISALTFVVKERDGAVVALAVISPAARYCSSFGVRHTRPVRRFVAALEWRGIERQIASGLPTKTLPPASPIASVLNDPPESRPVQWLYTTPITVQGPSWAAVALDGHLRGCLQAYGPRLKTEIQR